MAYSQELFDQYAMRMYGKTELSYEEERDLLESRLPEGGTVGDLVFSAPDKKSLEVPVAREEDSPTGEESEGFFDKNYWNPLYVAEQIIRSPLDSSAHIGGKISSGAAEAAGIAPKGS